MVVYLNRELFKPAMIVLSIAFGIFMLLFLILMIAVFHIALLIIFLALAVAYGVIVFLAWMVSKANKYYLEEKQGYLEIRYPTMNHGKGLMQMPYKAIVGFHYYPLKSKESWMNFINYGAVPGCTYITYISPRGQKVTELMGYITQDDAEALAQRYRVECTIM